VSWVGHVVCIGDAYRVSVVKPEGKSPLGRPKHRWKDDIDINLEEIEWKILDWINWWTSVNIIIHLWVLWGTIHFSRKMLLHAVGWAPNKWHNKNDSRLVYLCDWDPCLYITTHLYYNNIKRLCLKLWDFYHVSKLITIYMKITFLKNMYCLPSSNLCVFTSCDYVHWLKFQSLDHTS
jgi:hypothetical protein